MNGKVWYIPVVSINACTHTLLPFGLGTFQEVKKFFADKMFKTVSPRNVRISEAPSHGKPILEYEPRSRGTLAYLNLAKEVIEKNGAKKESVG